MELLLPDLYAQVHTLYVQRVHLHTFHTVLQLSHNKWPMCH